MFKRFFTKEDPNPFFIKDEKESLRKVFKYIFNSDIIKLENYIKEKNLTGNTFFWNLPLEVYYIDKKNDEKAEWHTPLMWFIFCNRKKKVLNLKLFNLLIQNGADVTFKNEKFENITPLMYVGECDFLEQKSSIEESPQNLTDAIILEIKKKEPSVIGDILNAKDNMGRTAIFYFIEAIYNDVLSLRDNEILEVFNDPFHEYGEIPNESSPKKLLRSIQNLKSIIEFYKANDVEIFINKFAMTDSDPTRKITPMTDSDLRNITLIMVTPIIYAMVQQLGILSLKFKITSQVRGYNDTITVLGLLELTKATKKIIKIIFKIIEDLIDPKEIKGIMNNRYNEHDKQADTDTLTGEVLGNDTLLIYMTKRKCFDLDFFRENKDFLEKYFDVSVENIEGRNAFYYYNQNPLVVDKALLKDEALLKDFLEDEARLKDFLTPKPVSVTGTEAEAGSVVDEVKDTGPDTGPVVDVDTDTVTGPDTVPEAAADTKAGTVNYRENITAGGKQSKRIRKIKKTSQNKRKKQKKQKKSQKIQRKQTKRRK